MEWQVKHGSALYMTHLSVILSVSLRTAVKSTVSSSVSEVISAAMRFIFALHILMMGCGAVNSRAKQSGTIVDIAPVLPLSIWTRFDDRQVKLSGQLKLCQLLSQLRLNWPRLKCTRNCATRVDDPDSRCFSRLSSQAARGELPR